MTYYVYALLDPRKEGPFKYGKWAFSHLPFYIGKGKGRRCYAHGKIGERCYNNYKDRLISKIKRSGLSPLVVIKRRNLQEETAFTLEESLIRKIGRHDLRTGPLVNLTNGGEGVSGRKIPNKERVRRSESMRSRSSLKKILTRKKLQRTLKGLSQEEKDKATRKRLASLDARSPIEKRESSIKRRAALLKSSPARMSARTKTLSEKSEAEKAETKRLKQVAWSNRTEAQKIDLKRKRRAVLAYKTEEELLDIRKRRSQSCKESKLSRTQEQKELWLSKMRATWDKKIKSKQKKEK